LTEVREGVLRLADGRDLAYVESGPSDAPVVLYCHGSPGSRREITVSAPVLRRRGVRARVVALSRPGYGPSTAKREYRFVDWPPDAAEALDRLGVDRFAVLGASGGSPFALACGPSLPDRVTRIGIVAGSAPLEATGMRTARGITGIPASPVLRRALFGVLALAASTPLRRRVLAWINRDLAPSDRDTLARPEVLDWFLSVVREAFAHGGRTAADEAARYREPWGFDPAEVSTETLLWYGGVDVREPVSAGRWLAERLPQATLAVWPEHGHFSWAANDAVADVVEALTMDAGRRRLG
jgi:pimeloyl-ACP methyl ester carboxylesterase